MLLRISVLLFLCARLAGAAETAPTNRLWFSVGEELIYDVHWGIFHVAQTHVTTAWTNYDGRPALCIRYVTKSNRFIETFYPVDDLLESVIDPETFRPYYFKKKLSEGKYRADEITTFDYDKLEMRWESLKNGRVKNLPIESDTRDLITLMYYLRSLPIAPGVTNAYRVMADEKIYDLFVVTSGQESMNLGKWGKMPCHRVEPQAAFEGLFVRKGKITFWVSLDERYLCTRIMATVPVANIRISLADVKGPGDDFWIKPVKRKEKKHVQTHRH